VPRIPPSAPSFNLQILIIKLTSLTSKLLREFEKTPPGQGTLASGRLYQTKCHIGRGRMTRYAVRTNCGIPSGLQRRH
jgi:hypothetical protein